MGVRRSLLVVGSDDVERSEGRGAVRE
jgi:hypothetical protein